MCYGRPYTLVMHKASAPGRQIGTTDGVATTKTLTPIGTRITAIVAIMSPEATTTTTSARVSVAAMKMVTTAAIDMVASLMGIIPCWITFCRKSSISSRFAKNPDSFLRIGDYLYDSAHTVGDTAASGGCGFRNHTSHI